MKNVLRKRKRKTARRLLALLCALAMLWPMCLQVVMAEGITGGTTTDTPATEPEEDSDLKNSSADILAEVVDGTVVLFKWVSKINTNEILPGEHYVAFLTEKNSSISYDTTWNGGEKLPCNGKWIPYPMFKYNKENFARNRVFYSCGSMGSTIMWWDGSSKDGDNGNCPRVSLIYCDKNGNPKATIDRNNGHHLTAGWISAPKVVSTAALSGTATESGTSGTSGTSEANAYEDYARKLATGTNKINLEEYAKNGNWWSCTYPEHDSKYDCFCFIKNISGSDPAMRIEGGNNGYIYSEREKDWSDRMYTHLFIGTPTVYSTLTRNYTIVDNQTLNLNAESESNKGVYIPRGITLTVQKGGTLCINETCYNDGTIVVDGGTLVIQEEGCLSPFAIDGMNKITVKNNGVVIVMKGKSNTQGGRLLISPDYPMVLSESRLINFGTVVVGGDLTLYSSFVENREGGKLLIGYEYGHRNTDNGNNGVEGNLAAMPAFADADLSQAGAGTIESVTALDDGGKIYYYDTKNHYASYGVLSNDGSMPGFSQSSDLKAKKLYDSGNALRQVLVQAGYRSSANP